MLVLKKNLRISERFPYPVRVEAILELIDQLPLRKLEKMTRKSPLLRYAYIVGQHCWMKLLCNAYNSQPFMIPNL